MLRLYGCPQPDGVGERRVLGVAWANDPANVAITYEIKGSEGFVRAEAVDRDGNFIYANPLRINVSSFVNHSGNAVRYKSYPPLPPGRSDEKISTRQS